MLFSINNSQILGSGSFGTVKKIKDWKRTKYAEKIILNNPCISKMKITERCMEPSALTEISTLSLYKEKSHPHIVKIKKINLEKNYTSFTMPMYKQNLDKWIKEKTFSERIKYIDKIGIQILSVLDFVSKYDMVHRDLKPNNILMDKNNAVVCDWGSATCLTYREELDFDVCTAYYRAPEIYLRKTTTIKSDLWSLGIILYNILSGNHLFNFKTDDEALDNIKKILNNPKEKSDSKLSFKIKYILLKKRLKLSAKYQNKFDNVCNLIEKLIVFDHEKRFNLEETKEHPLFSNIINKRKYKKIFIKDFCIDSLKSPCTKMFENLIKEDQDILIDFILGLDLDKGTQRYITVNFLRLLSFSQKISRVLDYRMELISLTYSIIKMFENSLIYLEDIVQLWNCILDKYTITNYSILKDIETMKNILMIEKKIFKQLNYKYIV